ncbi:hypothetical protein NFI96_023006, partial [Prochilodus magdalenae]
LVAVAMWSRQRGEAAVPPASVDNRREISPAWRDLNQSKTALRHIENHLEAVVGSGVVLDTLMNTEKTPVSGSRKASRRERRGVDDSTVSKSRRSRNPEKNSRSPLRNSTQDNSTERPHTSHFTSHREVSPHVRRSVLEPSAPATLSELVYERDSRPDQTADLDSTRSSALDNTTIRFLNDPPVPGSVGLEVRPSTLQADGQMGVPSTSVSSSPGSMSVRLEKLRQRQTDGKLEKLKERIRRQREQLEEAAETEKIISRLEQPVGTGASLGTAVPTTKVRKVAPAPPAPIYKGFNTSETTIRTADGKVWGEEEFHNCSRELYTRHITGVMKQKPKEREKVQERKSVKPVRKIHRSASAPDQQTRPVISTSSWREGQKLVKMILGPSPRLSSEPRAQSAERERRTGASSRTSSDPRLELNRRSRPNSSDRQAAKTSRPAGGDRGRTTRAHDSSRLTGADQDKDSSVKRPSRPAGGDRGRSHSTDLLSADIRGILDDLQLEGEAGGPEESARRKNAGSSERAPIRSSRSASPAKPRPEKKRQYDAEAVRQYIARQQEDRKRKQVEEKRSQKEAEQRRCQRLQELYRRQREGVSKPQAPPSNPAHSRLQNTYTKLLLEHTLQQPRPVYQPSGESDKENKRQEPLSPSHSDLSVSEHGPPALSRAELGMCSVPSAASLVPSAGQLFSQLLSMEGAAAVEKPPQHVDLSATHTINTQPSRTNHIDGHLHSSRLSRVEALKASAASLSSRIEREARKLAGDGINYGTNCSRNTGTGLPTVLQDGDAHWVKSLSPPVREYTRNADDQALRIKRLLRAGQSTFDGDTAELPGVGNLYNFGSREGGQCLSKPHSPLIGHTLPFMEGVEPLDSSGGSISEGPLTDSSLSEAEDLQGNFTSAPQNLPKPSLKLARSDYCSTLQNNCAQDPIALFQREADQHSPYRPGDILQDSRPPWGDLAKGSPHSVINIFAKNMHNYSKGMDVGAERVTPVLHASGSASNSLNGTAYEDDFISSHNSSQSAAKRTASSLSNGHSAAGAEERRDNEKSSKSSTPLSSPDSTHSTKRRGSERSLERPHKDGQRMTSLAASELQWNGVKKSSSLNSSPRGSHRSTDTDSTAGGISVHSVHSVASEAQLTPRSPVVSAGSPATSPRVSPPTASSHADPQCSSSSPRRSVVRDHGPTTAPETGSAQETNTSRAEFRNAGLAELQFAPGVLQQRLSAELSYLDAVEESVRQLGDVERVRAVSLAQQESVSLAQILKAQQQRQERELQMLKLKAEQEALETQRQLQESRERAAQMTDLARSQMLNVPSVTPLYDQQRQPRPPTDSRSEGPPGSAQSPKAETPSDSLSESIPSRRPTISGGGSSSRLSPSLSSSVKEPVDGGGVERSSSVEEEVHTAAEESLQTDSIQSMLEDRADSVSVATEYSMKFDESVTEDELEKSFRSLLPSESHWRDSIERNRSPLPESDEERSREKSSSQLSNKQDSSMPFSSGQDSFNKFTMAMVKQYMQEEEVRAQHQSSLLRLRHRALKEKTKAELAWLEHQKRQLICFAFSSARRLRDKGEDDKMPPIRKRQRGLLLKLQQEQAEIRRLQEANRAARRERQLLLKQQEEIERIRHSTLRLREKLKSAGDNSPRSQASGEVKEAEPSLVTDTETRSPSPLSVSGSETSSIMQKLKKMRYQMDERQCSPVLCFFSVFGAQHWASLRLCLPKLHPKFQLYIYTQLVRFLTEREQRLVRRRLQAEELLQWRQRLDAEEAAVRRMEKQALAAWEQQPQRKYSASPARDSAQSNTSTTHRQERSAGREAEDEDDSSVASSVRSAAWVSEQLVSPYSDGPASKPPSLQTSISSHMQTAQPSESPSHMVRITPWRGKGLIRLPQLITAPAVNWMYTVPGAASSNPQPKHRVTVQVVGAYSDYGDCWINFIPLCGVCAIIFRLCRTEAASDQSDIEGRVLALKEELRRRKAEVQRLKKAQKQRHKERLKAQEASLLKQLESYNNFIEKTKAELSKEADNTPTAKPQIKTPAAGTEKPRIRAPAIHSWPEGEKNLRTCREAEEKSLAESESAGRSDHLGNHEVTSSDEDPPTVTPTPVFGSPERAGAGVLSPEHQLSPTASSAKPQLNISADQSIVSSQGSEVIEELDYLKSEGSSNDNDLSHKDQNSHLLLNLDFQQPLHRAEAFEHKGPTSLSGKSGYEAEEKPDITTEDLISGSSLLNKALNKEPEAPPQKSPSSMADSYKKENLDEHREIPSTSVDGYNDDFESSLGSSFQEDNQEDNQESKSTSPSALRPEERSCKSSICSSEEEIDEELSVKSGITSGSFLPERPLDLDSLVKPSKDNFSDDIASSPKSPAMLPSSLSQDEMPSYTIGDRVLVSNVQPGTLRFKGQTSFANGFWAGVELDESEGSNDGTYDGVMYFHCKKGHGIFAPPDKVTHLPEKFESYVDNTEDEDSSFDDLKNKVLEKESSEGASQQSTQQNRKPDGDFHPEMRESSDKPSDFEPRKDSMHDTGGILEDCNGGTLPVANGESRDIILEFEDVSNGEITLPISSFSKTSGGLEEQTVDILDLLINDEKSRVEGPRKSSATSMDRVDGDVNENRSLSSLADKLLGSFMEDAVKQFQEIKKMKEKKIAAANLQKEVIISDSEEHEENDFIAKATNFHAFFDNDQEEVSSPELCNRSESPVLGPSGQEELAKRLAELELSRELLDALGDEQDWFDEDFGLSSRKEQEKLKRLHEEGSLSGSPQVKVPARPQLPQPKLPEEPAMLVPHTASEVEKLVSAALMEIWKHCGLGQGQQTLSGVQKPHPSEAFLSDCDRNDEQEAECAVFDLSWEVIQDIFMEDPNADQPQWVKPRRVSSSYIHRINSPNDITKVQAFVTSEVLKLYSLKKEQNHKTDWQKMLKFGRKKRDRVDHILVQELHEEEALWVNYDEDELFVKMQLADGIFDALLKDTAEILIQIQERRSKRPKF